MVVLIMRILNEKGEELLGAAPPPGAARAPNHDPLAHRATDCRWCDRPCARAGDGPGLQRGGFPPAPQPPRLAAPIDLTGYWVSLVTEDWRYRVATPPKGDYNSVPLNPAGRKAADAWDPARDEAAGEQCKAYGVGGVMRLPGRLHVIWQDDRTLNVETDAGTQVRTLRFGPATTGGSDWQGSRRLPGIAWKDRWGRAPLRRRRVWRWQYRGRFPEVVTKGMKPGYLRKNGVPYSADAVIDASTSDRFDLPGGDALIGCLDGSRRPDVPRPAVLGRACISRSSATRPDGSRRVHSPMISTDNEESSSCRDRRRGALPLRCDRAFADRRRYRAGARIRSLRLLVTGASRGRNGSRRRAGNWRLRRHPDQ